jgi:hypothetical protein
MGYFVEDMDDAKAISRTTQFIKPKPTGGNGGRALEARLTR